MAEQEIIKHTKKVLKVSNKLSAFLERKMVFVSKTDNNLKTLLKESSQLRFYLSTDDFILDILDRYHKVLQQCRMISAEISKEVE